MLKIRLMRIGAKKRPFYRVVAVDERAKRTGGYLELLGTYNPLTEPKDIKLKQDRIDYWVKQGAQLSTGYLRIIGKAPQRPPRKPKKESKQVTGNSEQAIKPDEAKQEEKAEEPAAVSEAKLEPVKAIGEVERTSEANESNPEQGAKQTLSEASGERSDALRPSEPTTDKPAPDKTS